MKTYTEEKRIRPDIMTASLYLAIAAMMAFAMVCHRIYGDKGAFFSAAPLSIYLFCYCGFVLSVQKAVYIMVRLRARRSQYHNAETNMRRSMSVFGFAAMGFGVLLMAVSYPLSQRVLGAGRGFFQLIIAGAAIIFLGGQGVLRGYLQGIGYTKPIVISDLFIAFAALVSGTAAVWIFYRYGVKVNGLFHVDEFSAVYGSAGLMVGLLFGSFVGCIQIVVSYKLRKSEIAEFVKTGAPRYLDNKNDVLAGIRPVLLLYCSPALMFIVDQCVYTIFTRKKNPDIDYITNFGAYSGRAVTTIILVSILCCMPFVKKWNRVMARIERDELEGARARFKTLMRLTYTLVIPVSVFIFAISGTFCNVLFGSCSDLSSTLMMYSGIAVLLCSFAIMFSWHLSHMGKSVIIMLNVGISWAVHVVGLILFLMLFDLGVNGVLISCIMAFLAYDLLCFFMISKMLRYRQDYYKSVLLPALSSGAAGLLVFLLNRLLVNHIGNLLTFIICVIVFYVSYMLVMVLTRGFMAHELRNIRLGFLFEGLASRLQHDRYYEG